MKEIELKLQGKQKRLTNETFKFDERVKEGWFSAVYFLKTKKIAEKYKPDEQVLMQFFQKDHAVLCGVDEAVALVKTFSSNSGDLVIHALEDGNKIEPYETVMTVEGKYQDFGFLEGLIDGILARRTSVATNVFNVVNAAKISGRKKPVIFMGDRDDHFTQQAGDGYSAFIGGSKAQATHAMSEWWGKKGMGTMPHALLQLFEGDIIQATRAYKETFPEDELVALVDYNNDVITDSLKVAREFGSELQTVRLDTSGSMVDQYFCRHPEVLGSFNPTGANPELIFALRKVLDEEGFQHVKIMVSGGFNAVRIEEYEAKDVPVDIYGIGSSLLKIHIGFTGDNVLLNGKHEAKAGRKYRPNNRMELVDY